MWWFRGLHANLVAAFAGGPAPRRLLDAGCGTGGLLARLAAAFPAATIVGLDLDRDALSLAKTKRAALLCRGSIDRLPFAAGAFDAVVSADVLCHRGVDELAALRDFHRCLRPGGVLALNLPAHRWLYSAHDVAVDNARRYSRGELRRLLAAAGFAGLRLRHWNSFLFPLMMVRRKLWPRRGERSEVELGAAAVDGAFGAVLALERRLARAGISLPFGGSIVATAVKP